ncbi:MAG: hypothetical protein QOJ07_3770, partial [Thermoleophilaceae bacterium]|nr:hypothetical protein [Thermoleophilaceae bacterium]
MADLSSDAMASTLPSTRHSRLAEQRRSLPDGPGV